MKLRDVLLLATFIAFAFILPACGVGAGTSAATYNYGPPVSLVVAPIPASVPVNGSVAFAASTSSTLPVVWTINASGAPGGVGTLTYPNGTNTALYTAPATPPVYPEIGTSGDQGIVYLTAMAYNSLNTPTISTLKLPIVAPSVTAGITPATASLGLGLNVYFDCYAVGAVSNGVSLAVNGIANGNTTVGTMYANGDYVAPSTMPMSGPTVTITCTSVADPTKSATAIVTLH